jgi:hypothetical protein
VLVGGSHRDTVNTERKGSNISGAFEPRVPDHKYGGKGDNYDETRSRPFTS